LPIDKRNWHAELAAIEDLCRVPNMNVGRIVRILERDLIRSNFQGEKNDANRQLADRFVSRMDKDNNPAYRIVPINNRYALLPSHINNEIIVPFLIDIIDENVEAIVELGCGYGRHLFMIRELIDHKFPELLYFGCEVTKNGLQAGKRISELEPARPNLSFVYFDFSEPSFEFLSSFRKIVFFSCHAIEQVKIIGTEMFHRLLDCAPSIECVHSEPVGWQFNDDVMQAIDSKASHIVGEKLNLGIFNDIDERSSAYLPTKLGWNHDLVAQLKALQSSGKIKINLIDRNCAGNHFYNPSTLLHWTKT